MPPTGWWRAPPFAQLDLLAGLFFLAAIAAVGLPPLSGFVGKLLILEALPGQPRTGSCCGPSLLVGSLLALIGFARAGSVVFWKCEAERGDAEPDRPSDDTAGLCAVAVLVAGPVLLALFAGPAMSAMDATARQLFAPAALHRGRARQRRRPRASADAMTRALPAPSAAVACS